MQGWVREAGPISAHTQHQKPDGPRAVAAGACLLLLLACEVPRGLYPREPCPCLAGVPGPAGTLSRLCPFPALPAVRSRWPLSVCHNGSICPRESGTCDESGLFSLLFREQVVKRVPADTREPGQSPWATQTPSCSSSTSCPVLSARLCLASGLALSLASVNWPWVLCHSLPSHSHCLMARTLPEASAERSPCARRRGERCAHA